MKFTVPRTIEDYIYQLLVNDRDILKFTESWNIEKSEVQEIIIAHYRELGIFAVLPGDHAEMIKEDVSFQLRANPELLNRQAAVQQEIERVKARQRR